MSRGAGKPYKRKAPCRECSAPPCESACRGGPRAPRRGAWCFVEGGGGGALACRINEERFHRAAIAAARLSSILPPCCRRCLNGKLRVALLRRGARRQW